MLKNSFLKQIILKMICNYKTKCFIYLGLPKGFSYLCDRQIDQPIILFFIFNFKTDIQSRNYAFVV